MDVLKHDLNTFVVIASLVLYAERCSAVIGP